MDDENNLEVVKNQLMELDILSQHNDDCYGYQDQAEASAHLEFKENDIFEYCKRVANVANVADVGVNSFPSMPNLKSLKVPITGLVND